MERERRADEIARHPAEQAAPDATIEARWRAFRTFWWGHTASHIGDHMTVLALPLAADRVSGSALAVGAVVSGETLATVIFGGLAGVMTDRRAPQPVMVTTDLARAGLLVALALLLRHQDPPVWLLVAAAFVLGLLRLLFDGAQSSLVARLVPDQLDVRSNSRLVLAENVGSTIGPLVGGWVAHVALWSAFGIDGATFALSAAALLAAGRAARHAGVHLGAAPTPPDGATRPGLVAEVRAAFALLGEHVVFRRCLVVIALFNVCALPIGQQIVTLASDLGLGPRGIGGLFAVAGVSGILSAPLVERDHRIRPAAPPLATGALGVVVLVVGLAPTVWTLVGAYAVGGVCFTFLMTHWAAMRQRLFTEAQQGQVTLTARTVLWSTIALGSLVTGRLADATTPATMWVLCGGVGVATLAWAAATGLLRARLDAPSPR